MLDEGGFVLDSKSGFDLDFDGIRDHISHGAQPGGEIVEGLAALEPGGDAVRPAGALRGRRPGQAKGEQENQQAQLPAGERQQDEKKAQPDTVSSYFDCMDCKIAPSWGCSPVTVNTMNSLLSANRNNLLFTPTLFLKVNV